MTAAVLSGAAEERRLPNRTLKFVSSPSRSAKVFEGIVYGKYPVSLFCRELDEKIDITLMSVKYEADLFRVSE